LGAPVSIGETRVTVSRLAKTENLGASLPRQAGTAVAVTHCARTGDAQA